MENFTEEEIKEIENMDAVKEMIAVLDTVLDGEVYHVRATETDVTLNKDLKPIIPKGLIKSKETVMLKNKSLYAFTLQVLIALLIDLNPINTEEEEDYLFRIAIITDAISMGSIYKNNNWIEADIEFDKKFLKTNGKNILEKNKEKVKKVQALMDAAHNFLAFSTMNMVRFNHHFPNEKINLIAKSLIALPDEQKDRLLDEEKFTTFYNCFVTAARISNDKLFYEKYLMKKENDNNEYFMFPILGVYTPNYTEEIINVRKECTPNSFLILDIINEIILDLKGKKLLFLVPYQRQLASLLNIREYIRKNPFAFHPAKNFYKCKAKNFEEVYNMFQVLMKEVGSFIYEYSENMYESVRSAKCRIKYQKNIKKDDELLVKAIFDISSTDRAISDNDKELIRKKLYIKKYEVKEETDMEQIISECDDNFNKLISEKLFE